MTAAGEGDSGFWTGPTKFIAGLAGLATAIAGLIGAVTAAGWFSPNDAPAGTDAPRPTSIVVAPTPEQPTRGTITLLYAGDALGCGLDLQFDIGDQTVVPTSASFTASGVQLGLQNYRSSGLIDCGFNGACEAQGAGQLQIADGAAFNIIWANTGVGICTLELA